MRLGHYVEDHDGGSVEIETDECDGPIHDKADAVMEMEDALRKSSEILCNTLGAFTAVRLVGAERHLPGLNSVEQRVKDQIAAIDAVLAKGTTP